MAAVVWAREEQYVESGIAKSGWISPKGRLRGGMYVWSEMVRFDVYRRIEDIIRKNAQANFVSSHGSGYLGLTRNEKLRTSLQIDMRHHSRSIGTQLVADRALEALLAKSYPA